MEKEQEYIDLEEVNAIVKLPENAVKVELNVHVFDGEKIVKASKTMDISEIRDAFRLAEEYYDDPEAYYTLTDKGKEFVAQLKNEKYM